MADTKLQKAGDLFGTAMGEVTALERYFATELASDTMLSLRAADAVGGENSDAPISIMDMGRPGEVVRIAVAKVVMVHTIDRRMEEKPRASRKPRRLPRETDEQYAERMRAVGAAQEAGASVPAPVKKRGKSRAKAAVVAQALPEEGGGQAQ